MKNFKLLLASSLFSVMTLYGDTIYFNNGSVLKGEIVEQNSNTLTIKIDGVNTTYGMRDIERLENSNISAPPPPPPAVTKTSNKITNGTVIHLITIQNINTRSHTNGHQFKMQLESDLYVNDKVVVQKGSEVYAEVISSNKQVVLPVNQVL